MTSTRMNNENVKQNQQPVVPGQVELKDPPVEGQVLGQMLRSDRSFHAGDEVLTVDAFTVPAFASTYKAAKILYRAGKPVDFVLLQDQIDKIDPAVQLEDIAAELQPTVVTEETLVEYAKRLQELAYRRAVRKHLLDSVPKVESDDQPIAQTFVDISAGLFQIQQTNQENHLHEHKEMVARFRKEMEDRRDGKEPDKGTMSGYPSLDDMTLGFRPGELVLIAGNTGHGKTTLAVNILLHMLLVEQRCIAMFSLEMAHNKLFARMGRSLFDKAVITKDGVKMTGEQWAIVEKALEQLESKEYPLFIDDTPSMHVDDMRSKMLYLAKHHGVTEFFLDYAQLAHGEGGNRQEEVAYVVQALRTIAKELNVAIIALAQFNRADVREQYLRMPKLYSMRESGALEMTADIVLSIMRPELIVDGLSIGGIPLKDRAVLSVLKNREGDRKHIDMLFDGPRTKFMELPHTMPSLVNAVLKTGGRADFVPSSGGTVYPTSASAGSSRTGTVANGQANGYRVGIQEKLPEMKNRRYVDDEDGVGVEV